MNLVLSDTEEYRIIKIKKPKTQSQAEETKGANDVNDQKQTQNIPIEREMKRALGLVLLRGENIITMSAEAPPGHQPRKIGEGVSVQPGIQNQIGRVAPINRNAPPLPMGPPMGQ